MQALLLLLALTAVQGVQGGPVGVGGAVQPPKKLRHVAPEYPDAARRAGLKGVVELNCTIDTEGRVSKVEPLKGPIPLRGPAVAAVKKWRYSPSLLDGRPVFVVMTVTVTFSDSRHVSLDELIASLRHEDEYIREAAALTLGRLGPQAADVVKALMATVQDESERVRKAAAEALESVEGK